MANKGSNGGTKGNSKNSMKNLMKPSNMKTQNTKDTSKRTPAVKPEQPKYC
jgi:hypothetical protein